MTNNTGRGFTNLVYHFDFTSFYHKEVKYEGEKILLINFSNKEINQLKELSKEFGFDIYSKGNDHFPLNISNYSIENISDEAFFYLKLKELL